MAYRNIYYDRVHFYWDYPEKLLSFIKRNSEAINLKKFNSELNEVSVKEILTKFPYEVFSESKIKRYIKKGDNAHSVDIDIKKVSSDEQTNKMIFAVLDLFAFMKTYKAPLCHEDMEDYNEIWLKKYYTLQLGDERLDTLFFAEVNENDMKNHYELMVESIDKQYGTKLFKRWDYSHIADFLITSDIRNRVQNLPAENKTEYQNDLIDKIRFFSENKPEKKNKGGEYSFASKLCNKWNPKEFPIYDSRILKLLQKLGYSDGKFNSLRKYSDYKEVMTKLAKDFRLFGNPISNDYSDQIDFKKMDRYLWTYQGEK